MLPAATNTHALIEVEPKHMDATLLKLEEAGAHIERSETTVFRHGELRWAVDITQEYPGFATDMQAKPALNSVAEGSGFGD